MQGGEGETTRTQKMLNIQPLPPSKLFVVGVFLQSTPTKVTLDIKTMALNREKGSSICYCLPS